VDPDDPGVRVQVIEGGESAEQTLRVWGLAPATAHTLELTVGSTTTAIEFETPAPLPGYRPSFPVEGGEGAEDVYRIFDFGQPFDMSDTGVFAIDAEGTTRWHYGVAADPDIPLRVPAGVQMTADNHVLFILDVHAVKMDALSTPVVDVDGGELDPSHLHHDLVELPNGNFIALGHSFRDIDYGGDEGVLNVAGDLLLEFTPAGELVWTWDTFDHMDPMRRRGGYEAIQLPIINPATMMPADFDWTHANGIVHDPSDDSLLVSFRHQDWIVKIDHSTGEIVWRFGPEGDFELAGGDWFSHQHSPQWQEDGSLLLYDNANDNPDAPMEEWNSRPVRYSLDYGAMTTRQEWSHEAEAHVSPVAGDADVMPGGHVLVLDSTYGSSMDIFERTCRLQEIDPTTNEVVWSMTGELADYSYRAVPSAVLPGMTLQH
jgi:outer membrane protein assembly factor BamB